MEGGQIGLRLLLVGKGVWRIYGYGGGDGGSGTFVSFGTILGDMSYLITSVASSFRSLPFFFSGDSHNGGSGSSSPYIHSIWVSVERIPPLRLCVTLILMSFEPIAQLDVFFLVESR